MKKLFALALLLTTAPLIAAGYGPFTIRESGQSFYRLDDAVKAIGENDGTITIAPGTYVDCASQRGGNITYRAAVMGSVVFDGGICEAKATLVLGGLSARVDGIIFQNQRVSDRNGAGIRLEKGDLTILNSMFRNAEQGILAGENPTGQVNIDHTTFSGLGGCPNGMCSHSLYMGDIGKLTVTRSRFEKGTGGHYLKTRSAQVVITDNSFDDTRGNTTNYMIDLSSGATGVISGNMFVQGVSKENHSAFITVAAEGRNHRSAGLVIADNDAKFAPGVTWGSVFVADFSHEPLRISGNRLAEGLKSLELR